MKPIPPRFAPRRAATALLALLACATPAIAADPTPSAANPIKGKMLFLQCRECHTMGQGDPAHTGPNLWGVVGATAGTRPGFVYSPALAKSKIVWDRVTLDKWLTRPAALVPGTKMAFAGVAAPASRADIIAFLDTLGPKSGGR